VLREGGRQRGGLGEGWSGRRGPARCACGQMRLGGGGGRGRYDVRYFRTECAGASDMLGHGNWQLQQHGV